MWNEILLSAFALCAILGFASLSGLVSERAGVVNIGIEGMMTIGALVTSIIGFYINDSSGSNNLSQFYVIFIGGLFAALFSLLHAFPSISLKSNQVISGTAINILALGIAAFLVSSSYFGTDRIDHYYSQVNLGSVLPVWLLIAIIFASLIALFFKFTKFGMRYTMVGENPNAVDAAGVSVNRYRYIAVIFSGFLAGVSGGVFIATLSGNSFRGSVNGYGFLAMGILIFGQWRIHWLALGVILFSILFAIGDNISRYFAVFNGYDSLLKAIPFILTLVVMILFSKRSKAPAANGIPFDKSKR